MAKEVDGQVPVNEGVLEAMLGQPVSDTTSTLIEFNDRRSGDLIPPEVLAQYEGNRFVEPCALPQREVIAFAGHVASSLPAEIEMIELSPVTSFGSNSTVAGLSQKTILTTDRNVEVVGDGVTALTLEAARRRRQGEGEDITLATVHRETRAQQHEQPGFTSHFHALSLIQARRTSEPEEFKAEAFDRHVQSYLNLLQGLSEVGYPVEAVGIDVSNIRLAEFFIKAYALDRDEVLRHTQTPGFGLGQLVGLEVPDKFAMGEFSEVADELTAQHPNLERPLAFTARMFEPLVRSVAEYSGDLDLSLNFDLMRHAGIGYYEDGCIKISAQNQARETYPLIDIGSNRWMAKLLTDKRQRIVTGGMGTELFMKKFRADGENS